MNVQQNSQFIEFSCPLFIHFSTSWSLRNATGSLCLLINTCDYAIRMLLLLPLQEGAGAAHPLDLDLCPVAPPGGALSLPATELLRERMLVLPNRVLGTGLCLHSLDYMWLPQTLAP